MKENNIVFDRLKSDDDIKEVIKYAFDVELDISGGWGYDEDSALVIHSTNIPKEQLQYTLASMRSHIQMNMILPPEKRYGGINITEIDRSVLENIRIYDIITFKINAMLEKTYNEFIQEYKLNLNSSDFNLEEHFNARKEATLTLQEQFWFDVTNLKS